MPKAEDTIVVFNFKASYLVSFQKPSDTGSRGYNE